MTSLERFCFNGTVITKYFYKMFLTVISTSLFLDKFTKLCYRFYKYLKNKRENDYKGVIIVKYEETFDMIAKQFYNAIFKYCCVRLKKENDAYDCTQEVFLIFFKKMNKLRISENIGAWLYRTADNVIKNFYRKNKTHISLDDVPDIPAEIDPESVVEADIPLSGIISEQEYKLIASYYIDKEDINVIAKNLNITKDAAYKRIQRIKAKIAKHIGKTNNAT